MDGWMYNILWIFQQIIFCAFLSLSYILYLIFISCNFHNPCGKRRNKNLLGTSWKWPFHHMSEIPFCLPSYRWVHINLTSMEIYLGAEETPFSTWKVIKYRRILFASAQMQQSVSCQFHNLPCDRVDWIIVQSVMVSWWKKAVFFSCSWFVFPCLFFQHFSTGLEEVKVLFFVKKKKKLIILFYIVCLS